MLKWTAFIFVFFTAFTMVFQMFVGGLINLDTSVDDSQREEFRQALILENLVSMDYNASNLSYSIEKRRAVLPVEFFTQESEGDQFGYQVNNGHCYFDRVAGLDGESYGFGVQPMFPVESGTGDDIRSIGCTDWPTGRPHVESPVLLKRDARPYSNPQLPARLYVYEIP
jgi:hypothetical protein